MQVSNNPIGLSSNYKQNSNKMSFGAKKESEYENPVSKKAEYAVSTLGSVMGSAVVAAGAGIVAHIVQASKAVEGAPVSKKVPAIIGAIAGLATLAITIGPKLYQTKLNTFVKQKEMDVYSRQKSAEITLSEKVDEQAKNDDVPLDEALNNYAKLQIGKKGAGIGIASL